MPYVLIRFVSCKCSTPYVLIRFVICVKNPPNQYGYLKASSLGTDIQSVFHVISLCNFVFWVEEYSC